MVVTVFRNLTESMSPADSTTSVRVTPDRNDFCVAAIGESHGHISDPLVSTALTSTSSSTFVETTRNHSLSSIVEIEHRPGLVITDPVTVLLSIPLVYPGAALPHLRYVADSLFGEC